jgi:cytochrome c-type biogenesis protein CcmH/NrfG
MRGNREAARRLLGQVIAKLPDDLNANMNLALVDAHDGRTREAITRLRKLKLVYPEAIELDALLAELEGRSLVVTRSAPGG